MEAKKSGFFDRFSDRAIISATVLLGFLPGFLSVLAQYTIFLCILLCRRTRGLVFSSRLSQWLIPLTPVAIIPPIVHKNYLGAVVGLGLVMILVFAVYLMQAITPEIFERATSLASAGSIFAAVVAVVEKIVYLFYPQIAENKDLRCASVFFNPNLFGTAVVFVILICLYKIISGRGSLWANLTVIGINLVSMALCGSLLGIAELVIGVLLLFVFNRNKIAVAVFSASAAAGVGAVCFYPRLLPRIFEASESLNLRYRVWQLSIILIKETPVFGRGLLAYMKYWPDYIDKDLPFKVWPTTCAHSMLLDGLLCFGIVGTVILIGFVVHMLLPALKCRFKKCDRAVTSLTFAMMGGFLFHGIFDETITWPSVGLMFFLIIAGSVAYGKEKSK